METPEEVVSESSKEAVESKAAPVENTETPEVKTEAPAVEGEEAKPEEEKRPEEENSVIRQMRKTLRMQQKQIAELRQAQLVKTEPAPVRDNYQSDAEYIQAEVSHQLKQVQNATPKAPDVFESKFNETAKAHPDFNEIIHDTDHIDFGANAPVLKQAVETLSYGGEILYHLAKNPELAEELAILPPAAFAARLGDIHGDIRQSKTKQVSRAPAPITPVSGAASKSDKSYDEITDQAEFEARRRKEKEAVRKARYGF
jgi:hypothetical protein